MKNLKIILFLLLLVLSCTANAQHPATPKYEYRAVWLTAIENLDWPSTQGLSLSAAERQKSELVNILDSLQAMNVNVVMLQTRVRGDLIYPSAIEPFSHLFTGTEGVKPCYDPLAFAIEECHRRGMQLHAWVVAMPLGKTDHVALLGRTSLPRRNPSLCTRYGDSWYMEPGNPATSEYLVSIVKEIVTKYDVDGIHLDYIRYPDRNDGYPDTALYRKYGKGLTLASWRRANITRIVKDVYTCVKSLKPWVRVSCATLGKYGNLSRYSSLGWDALNTGFQDAQQWMRDGIVDAVFPMLYFKGNNFYPFVRDWQENSYGRHVVPGIGIYRLLPEYGGWSPIEIMRQLQTSRAAGTSGNAMFRVRHLLCDSIGASEAYMPVCRTKALVPPMSWHGTKPSSPLSLTVERADGGYKLCWEGDSAARYNIYGAVGDSVNVDNPENLLACMLAGTSYTWYRTMADTITVAVTAVDAYGVESEPVKATFVVGELFEKEMLLPLPESCDMRMEVLDLYGRRLYYGRYARRVGVRGLKGGYYILKAYDRHGALLWSRRFATGR